METHPATLLRDARLAAGLSARSLARRAGVPTTTVTRIENGITDPTVGMLAQLVAAADHELVVSSRTREDAPSTLASLATAVEARNGRIRVDWTRLRAFADWAGRHPGDVAAAIADPPRRTETPLDAILAGFADLLAERTGIAAPPWTRSVPTPGETWAAPGTPTMRARAEATCPDAFRRRNILVPADAIFRDSPVAPPLTATSA